MINSIVMFWPTGNDSTKPKWSQPKFARIIALETGSDGKQRRARISYTNADQLKIDANGQLAGGPTQESYRSIDQLIPVDDASQIRSVEAMLGKANHIAYQHTPAPTSTILEKDDETKNETNIPPTQEDVGSTNDEDQNKTGLTEEDADTTDDEDEEEASKDPTYTNKAKIENSSKRVTRSNKNPEDIHCSLIAHK
jgi:hypothetical protein